MDKENQWSEINKDVADIAKKVKSKIDEEDLVEDLKDSFKKTVESATDIFKTLINTLDSTITDEEIRQDSKKVVENISAELKDVINETKFKTALLNFNLYLLKYTRPFLPPFFRLIAPARWAKQRLTRNPNLSFKDKSKLL